MSYLRKKTVQLNPINTPPTKAIRGREKDMVKAAGSTHYVFKENPFVILERFLILGTEKSTMYESSDTLTDKSTDNLDYCLDKDPAQAIKIIRSVSERGAGIKNDPAIFALAVAASHANPLTRQLAFESLSTVCRTGTHLLMFVSFADKIRGWGTGFKSAVWKWYEKLAESGKLDYQLAKYRNREGWTHRDIFRLLHKPVAQMDPKMARLIGTVAKGHVAPGGSFLELITEAKDVKNGKDMVKLLKFYPGATWEMLPTEALNYSEVWAHFIDEGMPFTALVRNLNRLTAHGLVDVFSEREKKIIATLTDTEIIKKSKIHPLNLLIAKLTYQSGRSVKGSSTWTPNPRISEALETSFLESFDYLEPTGLNYSIGLDISGSMGGYDLKDIPGLNPRVVSGVMALALVKAEKNVITGGFGHSYVKLPISKSDSLESVIRKISDKPFGATDCAIPVRHALAEKIPVDTFLVITDGETNRGPAHAAPELKRFRTEINPKAKMIMAATTANQTSITDPNDPLSLAIAGFDPALPRIVQEFSKF